MDVSKRIIELRNIKGLSQYKLIQLSGVKGLSQYENGKAPSPPVLERICVGLGVTMAEFYAGMDDRDIDPPSADPRRAELHRLVDALPPDKLETILRVVKAL